MPLRTSAAVLAGKAARAAAKRRGGGSAFPGLVAEKVDPRFLAHALREVRGGIVVVSGTNGKTTTTKMLVALLRAHGRRVFTNPTGSNFTRGVIEDLFGADRFDEEEFADPGTEDFSYVLEQVPGCYVSISACSADDPRTAADNHSAHAVFDDSVLPDCAAFLAEVALRRLSR